MAFNKIFKCPYTFEDDETLLSFQYKIIRVMLVILIVFSLGFAMMYSLGLREVNSYEHVARYIHAALGFAFLMTLQFKKNSLVFVSYALILSSLAFFTLTVLSADFDSFRMIWYIVLTIAAFMISGIALGLMTALFSGVIIQLAHENFDLGMNDASIATVHSSLFIITLMLYFATKKIHQIEDKISSKNSFLNTLASYDTLTGVMNRRLFLEMADKGLQNSRSSDENFYFLMLDIDHFKNINDTYGHKVGDEVLKTYADIIAHNLRDGDIFGRLGGEEFGITIVEKNYEAAFFMAQRLRLVIEEYPFTVDDKDLKVTASIGIAFGDERYSLEEVMHCADQAMYEAKNLGRNKISFFETAA